MATQKGFEIETFDQCSTSFELRPAVAPCGLWRSYFQSCVWTMVEPTIPGSKILSGVKVYNGMYDARCETQKNSLLSLLSIAGRQLPPHRTFFRDVKRVPATLWGFLCSPLLAPPSLSAPLQVSGSWTTKQSTQPVFTV